MKNFIFKIWISCLLSFVLVGCSGNTKEVRALANNFLEAYFETDYKKAASMCTDSLSVEFLNSLEEIEELSEGVKKELKNKASKVKVNITEIKEDDDDKNTVTVLYTIIMPESVEEITKSLVVKKVEEEWKIASL